MSSYVEKNVSKTTESVHKSDRSDDKFTSQFAFNPRELHSMQFYYELSQRHRLCPASQSGPQFDCL